MFRRMFGSFLFILGIWIILFHPSQAFPINFVSIILGAAFVCEGMIFALSPQKNKIDCNGWYEIIKMKLEGNQIIFTIKDVSNGKQMENLELPRNNFPIHIKEQAIPGLWFGFNWG